MKLKALILAGGKSTRMGKDKASLDYHGVAQSDYLIDMFTELSMSAFLSIRPDQKQEKEINYIVDQQTSIGPMAAILAAFEYELCPWLVIGCDYPLLEKSHIEDFLQARSDQHSATAVYESNSKMINPTIAIYEPKILSLIKAEFADGQYSLRKLLEQTDVSLYEQDDEAFVSVDTNEAYQKIKNKLSNGGAIHP